MTSIRVTPPTLTVSPDEAFCPPSFEAFAAIASYANGSVADVTTLATWSSSEPTVATIGASTGFVTAYALGTAQVTASFDGSTGSGIVVAASDPLVSITIEPTDPLVAPGATLQFTGTGTFADGTTCDVTGQASWQSSVPSVATIVSAGPTGGLVTGVLLGDTNISAMAENITGTTTLTVTAAPPGFDGGHGSSSVSGSGSTSSSNTASASTSSSVASRVLTSVTVTPSVQLVRFGGYCFSGFTATAAYSDGSMADVTSQSEWSASTPGIVEVGATTGIVTALSPGTTEVFAAFDGQTGMATATAGGGPLISISIAPQNAVVEVAGAQQFAASGVFSDGASCDVTPQATWQSSPSAVATISPTGLASGLAPGEVTISADVNGFNDSTTLTVTGAPSSDGGTDAPDGA